MEPIVTFKVLYCRTLCPFAQIEHCLNRSHSHPFYLLYVMPNINYIYSTPTFSLTHLNLLPRVFRLYCHCSTLYKSYYSYQYYCPYCGFGFYYSLFVCSSDYSPFLPPPPPPSPPQLLSHSVCVRRVSCALEAVRWRRVLVHLLHNPRYVLGHVCIDARQLWMGTHHAPGHDATDKPAVPVVRVTAE